MSNFSPSLSSISRMKLSSLTSQAASLCKSDVNVYSVRMSILSYGTKKTPCAKASVLHLGLLPGLRCCKKKLAGSIVVEHFAV